MITVREVSRRMHVWFTHRITDTSATSTEWCNVSYRGRMYSAGCRARGGYAGGYRGITTRDLASLLHSQIIRDLQQEQRCATSFSTSKRS